MPYQREPKFKPSADKMLDIPQPAIGGLNLKDLEFEQEVNQSPYMKNVMYRNGAFSKRYGQEIYSSFDDTVYAMVYYGGDIFVHSGTKIYKQSPVLTPEEVGSGFSEESGLFIVFQQKLYYMCSDGFFVYDTTFSPIDAYVPDYIINCAPDGESSRGDVMDDINIMGDKLNFGYNGTETATTYKVGPYDPDDLIDWTKTPTITVDDEETTAFSVDAVQKEIIFDSPPGDGDWNVIMTFYVNTSKYETAREETLSCKYYDTYGGTYNSRVFLAGDGKSRYYWCFSYDITYWPALNFARLGNTEDDITGFGRQYNALIAFKPRETYQIVAYIENSSSTIIPEDIGTEYFRALLVNPIIGCDAPHSIQVINNLLTWYNSKIGVCTLVSTNIADERNIRVISRNIDKTNVFGIDGILDIPNDEELPIDVVSADYDKKYFLIFPKSGRCFVWDYEISPYFYSSANGETPPARLTWFYFDKIYAERILVAGKKLLYISNYNKTQTYTTKQILDYRKAVGVNGGEVWWGLPVADDTPYYVYPNGIHSGLTYAENFEKGHLYFMQVKLKNTAGVNVEMVYGDSSVVFEPSNSFVKKSLAFEGSNEQFYIRTVEEATDVQFDCTSFMLFDLTNMFGDNAKNMVDVFEEGLTGFVVYDSSVTMEFGNDFTDNLVLLNLSFEDLDYDGNGVSDAIDSFYLTPFMQFNAVEYLKNVRNIYVQCRGDTNTLINISYYTDDSSEPEKDPEPIQVEGGGVLWNKFQWDNFRWYMNIWGNVFRRRCNMKDVEMFAVYFDNNEAEKDMSITHIGMQYQLVKYVR